MATDTPFTLSETREGSQKLRRRLTRLPAMPKRADPRSDLAAADPVLGRLIEEIGPLSVSERERRRRTVRPDDAFGALVRAVVGQQLSTKAARTIYGRLLDLFDGRVPGPKDLLSASEAELRGVGLSGRKVEYMRDLAMHVERGELELERLTELGDDEVIAEIVAVRGFGEWSAEMFLMFHLERPDVVSGGDLGIRRAIQLAYGLDELPSPAEVVERAEAWRPHRSLACLYLWESLAANPGMS
jgi:DNA-3-methyladenine glycosylase II